MKMCEADLEPKALVAVVLGILSTYKSRSIISDEPINHWFPDAKTRRELANFAEEINSEIERDRLARDLPAETRP